MLFGAFLVFAPGASAEGESDINLYNVEFVSPSSYDATSDTTSFTYRFTGPQGQDISHIVIGAFCVTPNGYTAGQFQAVDGSTGLTGLKIGDVMVGSTLTFTFDGELGTDASGSTWWLKKSDVKGPLTLPGPDCDPPDPCVDDPETAGDECNPCVDDPETAGDECNPPPPCVTNCGPPPPPENPTTTTTTTTTTTAPTTTTTVDVGSEVTTPTTAAPTTEAPATTAAPTTAAQTQVLGETVTRTLPRTGSSTGHLATAGIALMILGGILVGGSRRFQMS